MNATLPDSMTIKPLDTADYDKWALLWNAYLIFYKTSLSIGVSKKTWQNLLDDNTPIFGFGAYNNGKLIGIVHTVIHPTTWDLTDCCYLQDLYVDETMRLSGIGRALIEYVYSFATSKNCNRVYWATNEDNTTARKLYDKLANLTNMIQYRHNL